MLVIMDGLNGQLLPFGLQSTSAWKPLSSEVRIFLGITMVYGALIPFYRHHMRPATCLSHSTLLPNSAILIISLVWPVIMMWLREVSSLLVYAIILIIFALSALEHRYTDTHKRKSIEQDTGGDA